MSASKDGKLKNEGKQHKPVSRDTPTSNIFRLTRSMCTPDIFEAKPTANVKVWQKYQKVLILNMTWLSVANFKIYFLTMCNPMFCSYVFMHCNCMSQFDVDIKPPSDLYEALLWIVALLYVLLQMQRCQADWDLIWPCAQDRPFAFSKLLLVDHKQSFPAKMLELKFLFTRAEHEPSHGGQRSHSPKNL